MDSGANQEGDIVLITDGAINDLARRLTTKEVIDPNVIKILQDSGDLFLDNVLNYACKLAKHRKSDFLEI